MRTSRSSAAALVALSLAAFARSAAAAEVQVGGKPLEADVTNTAIGNYYFNNQNSVWKSPATRVDDDFFEFLDKFNLQLSWWRFQAGVRLDSYVAARPSASDIAALVAEDTCTQPSCMTQQVPKQQLALTNNYLEELNTRHLATVYPTKLFVAYQQPSFEVTLGDFYVQLGRGLVFSVRKIDELSIDTTTRGAKAAFDRNLGPVHLGLLAFGGEMNPVRLDETTGRRLNVTGKDPLFFGFPTGQEILEPEFNQFGTAITVDKLAQPNYLEDAAFGGKLELGTKLVNIAGNFAAVLRKDQYDQQLACKDAGKDTTASGSTIVQGLCSQLFPGFAQNDPSRESDRIQNFSGSLNFPNIAGHGDLYVEVAGQQLTDKQGNLPDSSGYAVYAAASVRGGPVTVSLEGKHYRSFFSIPANIDQTNIGFNAPEFNNIFYSQPPTAQSIYIEPVAGANPQICVTGGRAVVNYRFTPSAALFTWLGRFADWSEVDPTNYDCKTVEHGLSTETDTWDWAAGMELFFEHGKSKANFYAGALDNHEVDPHGSQQGIVASTFYREGYIRYDLVKHIAGPVSIQAQGWHRRRYAPTEQVGDWWEGENYTALQVSPHFSGIFGVEYQLDKVSCERVPADPSKFGTGTDPFVAKQNCVFFNGGAQWRSAGSGGVAGQIFDTVNLFVGQRRGALRCVSGVCRVFPPFSGAKVELVSRF